MQFGSATTRNCKIQSDSAIIHYCVVHSGSAVIHYCVMVLCCWSPVVRCGCPMSQSFDSRVLYSLLLNGISGLLFPWPSDIRSPVQVDFSPEARVRIPLLL